MKYTPDEIRAAILGLEPYAAECPNLIAELRRLLAEQARGPSSPWPMELGEEGPIVDIN